MRVLPISRVVLLAGLVSMFGIQPTDARWGKGATVRIATEGAYKPWNFRRAGQVVGFEIDLARMLCRDIGLDCVIRTEKWARMLPRLGEGHFDIVFAGMSITKPRKTKAAFTRPYATTPAVFVAPATGRSAATDTRRLTLSKVDAREEEALVALRKAVLNGIVGVQKGTTHEIFLREYIEGYARIRTYDRQPRLDRDVRSGQVTAMLVSMGYAIPLVRGKPDAALKIVGPRISGGPFGEGIGAAVRRSDTALADLFSDAIQARLADGSVARLSIKWFGYDLSATP